jgi:hypothetical protein
MFGSSKMPRVAIVGEQSYSSYSSLHNPNAKVCDVAQRYKFSGSSIHTPWKFAYWEAQHIWNKSIDFQIAIGI